MQAFQPALNSSKDTRHLTDEGALAQAYRLPHAAHSSRPPACHGQRVKLLLNLRAQAAPVSGERGSDTARQEKEREIGNGVKEGFWKWNGHRIRYQCAGRKGPPVILIHGFGGNWVFTYCSDHWRKNIPAMSTSCRVYAIDLLGYGYSDKPDPSLDRTLACPAPFRYLDETILFRSGEPNEIYNFEAWGQQIADFAADFIKEPCVLCCNSVGGLAGLQAARADTVLIKAVQVHNISLRMLHLTKQSRLQKFYVARLQKFLRTSRVGTAFFGAVAKPKAVKNVLRECYGNKDAVDDELVDFILKPGLEPGAAQVFLDFISYSGGPLPEDLIENAPCPVSILWGDKDPWEKIEWGRPFKEYESVEEFTELPGVGHCPMDENPEMVNPLMLAFVQRHLPPENYS